ncbi:putative arrestin-like protein [Phaeoacremonium minimum UCRPA7]|uniref:Putative arrestin-like protein n=1 Tax=Phaeoacremonium minimum (strain UCR-PA7) TaxID=1286976 RepID=R8BCK0_PHAM7|nr:putative arrestin-like protein [Phaeoacremonium minimum UCRPA7]EON97021.1 putative arrestin-like protein [Phaeoacremonium minimum UCRPA7]
MSIRIALDNPPEFYTNLDVVTGRIVLGLNRPEQVGAVIVKLEGESKTALSVPAGVQEDLGHSRRASNSGNIIHESHKILYKVQQVFPDENVPSVAMPVMLNPGQYAWPFRFKVPFNNACSDPNAMARMGGFAGAGGYASGSGLFGLGGIRVMDGSKQLMYPHVTKTLPPSFDGFPREAEIRYYIKVTIQRPGLFKENWRYQIGFKFLPIEAPRPPITNQEAYARRPFTFTPRTPVPLNPKRAKRSSFFAGMGSSSYQVPGPGPTPSEDGKQGQAQPPSIEMSARLPHPSILTCNKPVPLRLIAKKLVTSREQLYLTSLQIDLVGMTHVRCQDLINTETTRWVVTSRAGLAIPLCPPDDPIGAETVIPDTLWRDQPLPNTVMPSFITCNLSRSYQLELKLGVSWGLPPSSSNFRLGKAKEVGIVPQAIFLPLHFSTVEVYSGLAPPESLVEAMRQQSVRRPRPPPRPSAAQSAPVVPSADPLYPPQLAPGQTPGQAGAGAAAPPYDEAPPSYDEAMAEEMTGPVFPAGQTRPAYSGVTNENAPDSLPSKN